jgi:hypothetical protein
VSQKPVADEAPAPTSSPLTDKLLDRDVKIGAKLHLIKNLRQGSMEQATVADLLGFLSVPTANTTVRNEVCNLLHTEHNEKLAPVLIAGAGDAEQPKTWRNYCLQHLAEIYVTSANPAALDAIRAAATTAGPPTVRGAGLYTFGLLARRLDWSQEEERAAELRRLILANFAKDKHEDLRLAAIRACGIGDIQDFASKIRNVLADDTNSIVLRTAAADVLGQFRDADSTTQLRLATDSDSKRLAQAAARALEKIKKSPSQ